MELTLPGLEPTIPTMLNWHRWEVVTLHTSFYPVYFSDTLVNARFAI